MQQSELDWFYRGGAGHFFPKEWQAFLSLLTKDEMKNPIDSYYKHLFGENKENRIRFAQAWSKWEIALCKLDYQNDTQDFLIPNDFAQALARIEAYYFAHQGFLPYDKYIMHNCDKIKHIPATLFQGRYDMICPPKSAYELAMQLDKAQLHIVPNAGHSSSEKPMEAAIVSAFNNYMR